MTLIKDLGTRPIGKNGHKERFGVYECPKCKNRKERNTQSIKRNKPNVCKSCSTSMQMTKHGFANRGKQNTLYSVLQDIKARCYSKNHKKYPVYGGVGVTLCNEWSKDPSTFIYWALSHGYKRGLTIDKDELSEKLGIIPHTYSPETCQWISRSKNTSLSTRRINIKSRKTIKISIDDASEICEMYETGLFSQLEIAKHYKVGQPCISSITRAAYIKGQR